VYKAVFPPVEHDLRKLDKPVRSRIMAKINWLLEHAPDVSHEPLAASWVGLYKLRVGDTVGLVANPSHDGNPSY